MTTLTVPGAVPEGLPGTGSPRPQGPGRGKGPKGPPRGNAPNGPNRGNTPAGPGGGQGKKRGRGNAIGTAERRRHAGQRRAARREAGRGR
jgi:hypothetical protein